MASKLDGMRLPQSIRLSLSVRAVHFLTTGMAIALLAVASVNAGATTAQLACTPTGLKFGDVVVGQSESLLITVTNTGQTSVTVSEITVSNPEFTVSKLSLPLVLLAGQSLDLTVTLTPVGKGWAGGAIKFSSNASNATLALEVGGDGVSSESLTASPSTVSFGQVATGTSATLPVVVTNTRSWKVTLSAIQTAGSGFSISGPAFPLTLAGGQSLTLNVTFAPQSAGMTGGSLLVSGPGLTVPFTGTGTAVGQLTIAPALLNFGDVPVGTAGTQAITISAGGASVTVSSASSSSSQFTLDGASFPLTIAAGQSMSFNVAFTPQNSGAVSGSLTFASNGSSSQTLESLSGIGTVTQYNVSLLWNSASDVVGYNVYRSTAAKGTYSKINSTLNSGTAYTDSTVVSGQTYYYAATSVNAGGQESSLSTPVVQAVVP
jgi:hypothetical protein